ncbi:PREDICTED: delta(7)-sterol-C5(6)-desaturase 1-like [Tarenaya hassleriana]|uniref:delta(7)-sterol-C5(6)-desaturase 1-like n=1 Tax=Tarenaya hassleriana TaxID=28532 RepID=UPI00053C628F|nr:PREDICTED: delta(7)-sterol-C5(6)-desaturase 1-like [Tarenaya hassleriana]
MKEAEYLRWLTEETTSYNDIIGIFFPATMWKQMPHFVQTLLRNYITSVVVYFLLCFLWCFYFYYFKSNVYTPKDSRIPWRKSVIMSQISVSMKAMPWISTVAAISERMIEGGWTKCYISISEVGPLAYIMHVLIHAMFVEFWLYWTHRAMHDIKPLYKRFHSVHHKFNKEDSLSPFAGPASHPVEAVLDVVPFMVLLFLVPMHFTTELILMSLNGIWTLYTHSCVDAEIWPIMSADYHTLHHVTHRYNYGNYTVLMDWMFGTLRPPSIHGDEDKAK